MEADQDTGNAALQDRIRELIPKVLFYSTSEKALYSQKSRLKHLLQSDRSTTFFHSLAKRNNSRNMITLLCREDGTVTKDQDEIIDRFVQYYKGFLGTEGSVQPLKTEVLQRGYRLNDEDNEGLSREVTVEEIKEALFNISVDKSPGPDGYTSAFYRKHWDFIGGDLVSAVKEFFSTGKLLKSLNTTAIALIPKTLTNPGAA